MYIVIGLGNPGVKYKNHRHNVGFMTLDAYASGNAAHFVEKSFFESQVAQSGELLLVKPETFMNDSGRAARMVAKQFSDAPVAVVYDDIDIPLGIVKCSYDRGAGGHNGVQSIIDHLGHQKFFRIRIGVRPVHEELMSRIAPPDGFEKFLLSDFAPFETELKEQGIAKAIEIVKALPTKSVEELMNLHN